jgi:hypothetical protein
MVYMDTGLLNSRWLWGSLVAFVFLASTLAARASEFRADNPINPPPPIYWCPNRTTDQQIATVQEPGCVPLVEKEKKKKEETAQEGKKAEPKELIKVVEIQNEASKFAQRYRKFLDCCATESGSLEEIDKLEDEATHILKSVQQKGIFNSAGQPSSAAPGKGGSLGTFSRQWTLSEIVGTVARARADLRKLRTRLEQLDEAKDKLDGMGYEAAGHERKRIQEEEQAIKQEFRSKMPPASARTGMEIQNTTIPTRIGGDIENTTLKKDFGADIGYTVSPYSDVRESLRLKRGPDIKDIQHTTTPNEYGPAIQDTTLQPSVGFEIGTPQGPTGSSTLPSKAGPSIGDSSLNNR